MPLNKKKPPGGLGRLVQAATPTLTEALTKAGEVYNQNERAWHKRNTEYQITRGSQRRRVPSPYGKALRQAETAVVEKLEELIASGQVVYGQYRRPVSGDPGDDRFLMAAEFGGLAFPAAGLEMVIQSLEALKARDRNQKVPAGVADQALDLAKVGVVGSNPIARSSFP